MVRRRQSEVEQYAISVVCDRQIKHVLIRQRSDKLYAIGTPKHNEKVETLYTLVHTAVCLLLLQIRFVKLTPNSITLAGSSWFEAGQRPASNLLRTSFEPASVMEFGFYLLCTWLPHAVNCVFGGGAMSVTFFSVHEISREQLNWFAPSSQEDVFDPWLGRVWRSRSKVKGHGLQEQKLHFSAVSTACMRFMFGETSLASSVVDVVLCCCVYQLFSGVNELISFYHNNPIELAETRDYVKLAASPPK